MEYVMTYKDRIYELLFCLENEFIIEEKVAEENRKIFVEIVKEFIRYDFGKEKNFVIEFSSDYKKIRKLNL